MHLLSTLSNLHTAFIMFANNLLIEILIDFCLLIFYFFNFCLLMRILKSRKYVSLIKVVLAALVIRPTLSKEFQTLMCMQGVDNLCELKPRRYDIEDLGHANLFHGWVDVQGQGVANDYCRILGALPFRVLACALAGSHGCPDNNFQSAPGFEVGHNQTWYMRDEDNDQKDDYCRCLGPSGGPSQVVCAKAGPNGFSGTFTLLGTTNCENKPVRPEFGREYVIP